MSKEKGDFTNAFAPVPHMSGIRTVMSIATKKGDGIHYGGRVETDDTGRGSNQLWGFVDADFASDEETRRSHTGYCLFLNGGPVLGPVKVE